MRTRYKEHGKAGKANLTTSDDLASYFLQASTFDVDFVLDTASAQVKMDWQRAFKLKRASQYKVKYISMLIHVQFS